MSVKRKNDPDLSPNHHANSPVRVTDNRRHVYPPTQPGGESIGSQPHKREIRKLESKNTSK
jgi:hypothetical protein